MLIALNSPSSPKLGTQGWQCNLGSSHAVLRAEPAQFSIIFLDMTWEICSWVLHGFAKCLACNCKETWRLKILSFLHTLDLGKRSPQLSKVQKFDTQVS